MKINKQKFKKKSYTHKKIRILCHQGIYTLAENQEIYFRSRHRKHFYETGLLKVTNKTLESDHGGKQELERKSFLQCIRKNTVLRHRTFLQQKWDTHEWTTTFSAVTTARLENLASTCVPITTAHTAFRKHRWSTQRPQQFQHVCFMVQSRNP